MFLKFENLQYTASYKERGACNKLSQLMPEERATCSRFCGCCVPMVSMPTRFD